MPGNIGRNLQVDMNEVKLLDIDCLDEAMFRYRRAKALSVGGEAPALDSLLEWNKSSLEDYRAIAAGLKMMCFNRIIPKSNRLVNCIGYSGLIEIKAPRKNARLFCFVDKRGSSNEELVICTGSFWKKSGEKARAKVRQDASMAEAYRLRSIYLESRKED